jgi:hypothetical protein
MSKVSSRKLKFRNHSTPIYFDLWLGRMAEANPGSESVTRTTQVTGFKSWLPERWFYPEEQPKTILILEPEASFKIEIS